MNILLVKRQVKKVVSVAVYIQYLWIHDKLVKKELAKERKLLEIHTKYEQAVKLKQSREENNNQDKFDFDEDLVPRSQTETELTSI